jgi:D-alanyl-D-alanine carboxypeptidase
LGTKINLKSDSIITIEDALYALLLVSANNSATILANNLGHLVKKKKKENILVASI